MTEKLKQITGILMMLVLTFSLVSFVSAYGIASPYWKGGDPLVISPGDTKLVRITLQQPADDNDVVVDVRMKDGAGVASIREGEYNVEAGTKDTEVLVTVTIPEGTPLGTEYDVTLSSAPLISSDAQGVSLGVSIDTTFHVLVQDVAKTEETLPEGRLNVVWILLILGILLVGTIIYFVISRKKKSSKKK